MRIFDKNHYYFFLSASPWPLVSSLSSIFLFLSIYIFFKSGFFYPLLVSFLVIFLVSYQWWRDLSVEYLFDGLNSISLESCLKNSIILFITSEVLFFVSFFWSYFHYIFSDCIELGWHWSSFGILMFDYSNVPLVNTLILLTSGLTITLSHYYHLINQFNFSTLYLFLTLFLGLFFTFLQYIEYKRSFFSMFDSSFGRVFYLLTGFHGTHVLIGRIFILVVSLRRINFKLTYDSILRFELCSWYWHFVDVVWLLLYFFLYYLSFLRFSIYSTIDFHSFSLNVNIHVIMVLFYYFIYFFNNLYSFLFSVL